MATVDDRRTAAVGASRKKSRPSGPRHWRWTAEQYRRLDELGFFEDHHVELIDGAIIELTTKFTATLDPIPTDQAGIATLRSRSCRLMGTLLRSPRPT